jgi:hypothetical protein
LNSKYSVQRVDQIRQTVLQIIDIKYDVLATQDFPLRYCKNLVTDSTQLVITEHGLVVPGAVTLLLSEVINPRSEEWH